MKRHCSNPLHTFVTQWHLSPVVLGPIEDLQVRRLAVYYCELLFTMAASVKEDAKCFHKVIEYG